MHQPLSSPGVFVLAARPRAFITATGVAAAVLGALVLIAWYAHLAVIVQLRPGLAPMQYNTALCLVLAGTGLALRAGGRLKATVAPGAAVVLLSGATLLEYLAQIDLGLDQLFFHPYILTGSPHPGRMSPVSAVCVFQIGLALLISASRFERRWSMAIVGALGSISIAICIMALLGYATGLQGTYGWGKMGRMALHTGGGLLFLATGMLTLAWQGPRDPGQLTPNWLPWPVGLGVLAASLVLYQALDAQQNKQITETIRAGAESVTNQVKVRVESRMRAFQRMARHWGFGGRPAREAWEDDANAMVHDFPDLRALGWLDTDHILRWVAPHEGNEDKIGQKLTVEEKRRQAVALALAERQPTITGTVTLFRGGLGYVIYVPVFVGEKFDGLIAAAFNSEPAFRQYLPSTVAAGDCIRLLEGGKVFYERDAEPLTSHREWMVESQIQLRGATWTIQVWPTKATLAKLDAPWPELSLAVGAIAAGLLSLMTYLAQRASSEKREIEAIHQALVAAQREVKTLTGLLPICAACKRIRDEAGHWNRLEAFVSKRTEVSFSHGTCPECAVVFCREAGMEVPEHIQAEIDLGRFDP